MTVVNPKSISGINSITTGSGSDDLLTIHTNNGTERLRVDSTGATKIVTGIVTTLTATTGIVTTFEATTGNITTLRAPTGIVTTLTATTGIVTSLTTNTLTANSTAKVGTGVTLSPDGDVFATGVTTCLGTSVAGNVIVGAAVTITSTGIVASGLGINCANINGGQIGRRNIVINGAMRINQRGTSSHTINSGNTKPPIKPEIVFFGLILVNFGPFNILPKKYPPRSVKTQINKINKNNKAASKSL